MRLWGSPRSPRRRGLGQTACRGKARVLRSLLVPPDLAIPYESYPLVGTAAVLVWFHGLSSVLGETKVIDHYINEEINAICTEAELGIVNPPGALGVADRFMVTAAGKIIDQENHYDPRPALLPGRR